MATRILAPPLSGESTPPAFAATPRVSYPAQIPQCLCGKAQQQGRAFQRTVYGAGPTGRGGSRSAGRSIEGSVWFLHRRSSQRPAKVCHIRRICNRYNRSSTCSTGCSSSLLLRLRPAALDYCAEMWTCERARAWAPGLTVQEFWVIAGVYHNHLQLAIVRQSVARLLNKGGDISSPIILLYKEGKTKRRTMLRNNVLSRPLSFAFRQGPLDAQEPMLQLFSLIHSPQQIPWLLAIP